MYIRCFIPLAQDVRGYEFKGRAPAGRAMVEGRNTSGKFTCRVQDLKPLVKYRVYIVFATGGEFGNLDMGLLDVDEKGRGEFRRDLDGENWANVVAVVVLADGVAGHISPLCGYRDVAVPWRQGFVIANPVSHDTDGAETTNVSTALEATGSVDVKQNCYTKQKQLEVVEEKLVVETPEPEAEPQAIEILEEPLEPACNQVHTVLTEIYENSAPWQPQNPQLSALDVNWVRCNYIRTFDELKLPLTMSDPFLQNAWMDYGHFVAGLGDGIYAIGVPGEFTPANEDMAKAIGLVFHGQKEIPQHGEEGYWVINVNVLA